MKYRLNMKALLLIFLAPSAVLVPSSALALPESCNDFQKLLAPRMALIAQINGFKSKRPSAAQACSVLTRLIAADGKILKWMDANKDWCQVPEDQVTGLKQASGQSSAFKAKACSAAVQQQKQIGQMRRQQQQQQQSGQVAPGAGVKLPQGAL